MSDKCLINLLVLLKTASISLLLDYAQAMNKSSWESKETTYTGHALQLTKHHKLKGLWVPSFSFLSFYSSFLGLSWLANICFCAQRLPEICVSTAKRLFGGVLPPPAWCCGPPPNVCESQKLEPRSGLKSASKTEKRFPPDAKCRGAAPLSIFQVIFLALRQKVKGTSTATPLIPPSD